MYQSHQASGASLQRTGTTMPATVPRTSLDRFNRNPVTGLRQAEEFSTKLEKMRRAGYISAGVLVAFTFVCVYLFLQGVDIIALYSAGVVVMLIQLAMAGADYYYEERRAAQAYWIYLDQYSYDVISRLRQSSRLSDWSKYEVDKYLAATHLKW